MLTPERIAEMDKITGRTTPTKVSSSGRSRADEIRALKPPELPIVEAGRRTIDTFKKLGTDVKSAFSDVPKDAVEGSIDPVTGKPSLGKSILAAPAAAGKALGKTAGAIARGTGALIALPFDTFFTGLKQKNPELIEKVKSSQGYKDISEAFNPENLTPEASKLLSTLSEKAKANPDISSSLLDAMEVVLLGGAGAVEKQIVTKGKKVFNAVQDAIPTIPVVEKAAVGFTEAIEDSKKILNPSQKYTPTEVERLRQTGQVKTKGKGPFKKEVADPKTTPQHETIASLVEEGKISSKNLPSENIKIIKQEARINDANIDEIVSRPELNKPFTKNTVNKVFTSIENSAKKDLVFVSDSAEEKIYKAVIGVAKEELSLNPLNSAGLRKSIKAFNARMEEILGKDIYTGASESVGNARLQAAKDIRHSLNDFLAENLESPPIKVNKVLAGQKIVNKLPTKAEYELGKTKAGDVYLTQLRREAQLLNAADEIAYRTRGTLNKTEIKKWLDSHPKFKKAAGFVGTAIGGKIGFDLLTD